MVSFQILLLLLRGQLSEKLFRGLRQKLHLLLLLILTIILILLVVFFLTAPVMAVAVMLLLALFDRPPLLHALLEIRIARHFHRHGVHLILALKLANVGHLFQTKADRFKLSLDTGIHVAQVGLDRTASRLDGTIGLDDELLQSFDHRFQGLLVPLHRFEFLRIHPDINLISFAQSSQRRTHDTHDHFAIALELVPHHAFGDLPGEPHDLRFHIEHHLAAKSHQVYELKLESLDHLLELSLTGLASLGQARFHTFLITLLTGLLTSFLGGLLSLSHRFLNDLLSLHPRLVRHLLGVAHYLFSLGLGLIDNLLADLLGGRRLRRLLGHLSLT